MNLKRSLTALLFMVIPSLLFSQQWEAKKARLMTKYAQDVTTTNVLPEYPRPQMAREKWLNLSGSISPEPLRESRYQKVIYLEKSWYHFR